MTAKYVSFPVSLLEGLGIKLDAACLRRRGSEAAIDCCFQIPAAALHSGRCYHYVSGGWRIASPESISNGSTEVAIRQVHWVALEPGGESVSLTLG